MQDGTWVCRKTLTVTVLTVGVQLQPQQGLLGFTLMRNWDIGAEFGDMARSNGLCCPLRMVGGETRESHVPSRGIYKQLLSQWEALVHIWASIPTTGDQTLPHDRAMTATEQTGFVQQPVQALITTTQNIPTSRTMAKKTKLASISKKQSSHQKL